MCQCHYLCINNGLIAPAYPPQKTGWRKAADTIKIFLVVSSLMLEPVANTSMWFSSLYHNKKSSPNFFASNYPGIYRSPQFYTRCNLKYQPL
ncbi:hypothetical protein T07_13238 [Trichinella nelsoni]|uniref:Uncharacterized protein n=1 Tax=Trichinella nelsoni TaxID=6336 RepID=A0A0V0SJX1_9BILA|nr:hypothetical protein T07_13238 [Trichinella nelsoni]